MRGVGDVDLSGGDSSTKVPIVEGREGRVPTMVCPTHKKGQVG